jgi:predicted DNA-binding transcriptional regulator AlpA
MAKDNNELPRRFVRTKEAAHFVGLCARTMEKHRTYGTGPRYCKIGGRILYDVEDLREWIAISRRSSTSDTDTTDIPPAKPHAARAPAYAGRQRQR